MNREPEISVILPFHNSASTVVAATRSVLRQTLRSLELIAIDDGSEDDGFQMLAKIRDPRLRLYRNEKNLGVAATRNIGMDMATGRFIAPMDADDVCRRDRLARTWKRLQQQPELAACGGWGRWVGWSRWPYVLPLPTEPETIRAYLLLGVPFHHGTLLFRRSVIDTHGLRYPEAWRAAVDYGFFRALVRVAPIANVPHALLNYLCSPRGISRQHAEEAARHRLEGIREEMNRTLPEGVSETELRRHIHIGNGGGAASEAELATSGEWLKCLCRQNCSRGVYSPGALEAACGMVWFRVCRNSAHLGYAAWKAWIDSPWSSAYRPLAGERLSFLGSWAMARILPSRRTPQGGVAGV